ncbi:hypothetical protein G6F43_010990 [Rhizopus delemar]|nr:hypothetical protein G6F43_010990 [Rhizopus delemar]
MLQSQVINVLPRRILAGLWATPETRMTLSHFTTNKEQQTPVAITPHFLCGELPIRYTHLLRLLSTLSPDSLQKPVIKHVAHSYLRDICTLLHPSLKQTSPKAFSTVLTQLRTSQALNLIRLRYAFSSSPNSVNLLENMNTIGIGIHLLLDQHISWVTNKSNHVQTICPEQITHQAVQDAQSAFSDLSGRIPKIEICSRSKQELDHIPSVLHRVLYESILLCLKAQWIQSEEQERRTRWYQRMFPRPPPFTKLSIFGGPTSVGFKLDTNALVSENDLLPSIPRDPIGLPTCSHVLSSTSQHHLDRLQPNKALEWASLSGWKMAKSLASHWGGNLDVVNVDGLGSTIYLAFDRNTHLLERYPSRHAVHVRNQVDTLSIQTASSQLDAFLYAISGTPQQQQQQSIFAPHHHSVSLTAAVGHA